MEPIKFKLRRFSPLRSLIIPLLGLLGGLAGGWGFFSLLSALPELTSQQTVYGIVAMAGTALSYTYLGWFIRSQWEGFGWRTIKSGTVNSVEDLCKTVTKKDLES